MTGVLVLSVAHDVADARLHRLCGSFAAAGAEVSLFGLGDADDAPPGVECVTWQRVGWARRGLRALVAPLRHRGAIVVVVDPDLIPVAVLVRKLGMSRFLICDMHEDFVKLVEDRNWGSALARRVALAVALAARRLAAAADMTIVADDHVPPLTARNRRTVHNTPTLKRTEPDLTVTEFRAVYVGDVRASRGAISMVEAVLACPEWKLDLIGPINSSRDCERIARLTEGCDRIRIWGRRTPGESWEIARGGSVGMSVLDDTPAFRDALPSKFYQYANEGMAVITSPLPRPKDLVAAHGIGAIAATADEIAAQLRRWSEHPAELDACRRRAREWSRSTLGDVDEFDAVITEVMSRLVTCGCPTNRYGRSS